MSGIGSNNGWLEAAIAWEVCASLHRQYCKGKDDLFTTRQSDFVKHAENARERISHEQAPAVAEAILFEHEDGRYAVNPDTTGDPAWHRLGPVDVSAIRSQHPTPSAAQAEQQMVAYLDIGAGGYIDLGSELTDEALLRLPKGRHVLVIAGTFGIDGYVAAKPSHTPQADSQPAPVADNLRALFREALAWGMPYGPEIPAHQWAEMRESMVEQYVSRAARAPADSVLEDAARAVLAERQRQISAEGWTPEHDDEYQSGELSQAAACYASQAFGQYSISAFWPWAAKWWKPSQDPRRNLEKAGALILAEMERIDRAARKQGGA